MMEPFQFHFEEVAIFFILHCETVNNHFLCIMQAASDIIKSSIICIILDGWHNVKDDKEFFNSLLERFHSRASAFVKLRFYYND